MTKAFLEAMVLKPENEKLVIEAFSEKSLNKVKKFDTKRQSKLKKTTDRKLTVNDILVLS
jgi:ATP phosphoribosyltransferase regulatory subunit HisZ